MLDGFSGASTKSENLGVAFLTCSTTQSPLVAEALLMLTLRLSHRLVRY
jgi:hypothetical protein